MERRPESPTGASTSLAWRMSRAARSDSYIGMTARDRAAQELRHRILLGDLSAGDRIDLDKLAAQFGTSRTPIREALLELADDGLVRMAPRTGITVLGVTETDLLDNFDLMASLSGSAARWAAERASVPERAQIAQRRDEVAEAARQGGDVALANFEFHRCINHASHSPRVKALIARTARLFPERFSVAVPEQVPCSLREHDLIVDAIAAGEGQRAHDEMENHFRAAATRLRAHLAKNLGDTSVTRSFTT